ncbi:glycoside hydrolase family 113 [Thalassotalea montiporae]
MRPFISIIFSVFLFTPLLNWAQNLNGVEKINGVSFVATNQTLNSSDLNPVKDINVNWITVMPFGFIRPNSAEVLYNSNFQWKGETVAGIKQTIRLAHQQQLKVMLKPHVWMRNQWIGDLSFSTEGQWLIFENSYTNYIFEFAKVAEELNVGIFAIGVELKKSVILRPDFWRELSDKVRTIYSGKITYAANWDNYNNVSFWDKLDYIGIDAYFPVATAKTPSHDAFYAGWSSHYSAIKKFSYSQQKKIIFTEFGYRNIDYTGKEPWNQAVNSTFNSIAQENAYRAIFSRFWGESWFLGGFLWKWFPDHAKSGGINNNRFTPQNKPVEKTIKAFYKLTPPK